jgi:hypothetical protein
LPRGYVDDQGRLHRTGRMRLATARDELEPLRDPRVSGPDDPRLTVMVLARVIEQLGDLELVTTHEIEGLFAVDLAFLQDFYGVINFGTQEEFEALLQAQQSTALVGDRPAPAQQEAPPDPDAPGEDGEQDSSRASAGSGPGRGSVEELPRRAL